MEGGCTNSSRCVGEAVWRNAVNSTGWAALEVETQPEWGDAVQARAAGWLEGWLTSSILHYQYKNTIVGRCEGKEELCSRIDRWAGQGRASAAVVCRQVGGK